MVVGAPLVASRLATDVLLAILTVPIGPNRLL